MTSSITLHKFGVLPDDPENHVFTFIFENPQKLSEPGGKIKSVESSEVSYGGHKWSLVCMRKDDKYMGIFLKWKYTDGQSISNVSCKAKYSLCLVHRHDYSCNKYFHSNQKFTSSQSLLGKSKFIPLHDLLDYATGYLDETGKRAVLELCIMNSSSRFEKVVDISPKAKTRKNASGYYFDTGSFAIANHRWYLRVYPQKITSNSLPAVYLYLSNKARGITLDVHFRLYIGADTTEMLTYNFGEGAKFDGFGKTLPEPLYNFEKLTEITIGVEVRDIIIAKDLAINVRGAGAGASQVYAPHLYNQNMYSSKYGAQQNGGGAFNSNSNDAFQDQDGNYWRVELDRSQRTDQRVTMTLDKGVHHYPQNKTKLLCWSAMILSRDPTMIRDIEMNGDPICGYFSNFIDDKGYLMTFPLELQELEEKNSAYTDENGEFYLRIQIISLQTVPVGMRAIPRFEYQAKHLLRARRLLQEKQRNLEEMKDMAASRASLSMLDMSVVGRSDAGDSRILSESSSNSGGGRHSKVQMYKSYDSLDALSSGDMLSSTHDDEQSKSFFGEVLRQIATSPDNGTLQPQPDTVFITQRDVFNGTREDASVESGITMSDETSLFSEARPSPVDMGKQKEVVSLLIKYMQQRLPLRVSEVLELGSLGTGTSTRSRMDVDLVLYSPDLPKEGQGKWMAPLLRAISNFLQKVSVTPDPLFPLPKCSHFLNSPYAVQFTCGGVDIDLMASYDWTSEETGGYDLLYEATCLQPTKAARQWYALATARLQKKFIADQPSEVKELMKVVKHWRNCVQWRKTAYRPNSYLLSLLIIKAVEELKVTEMKPILQHVESYLMTPELSMQWSTYYLPEKFQVEFEPPTPLVRDPANPGVNVADTLPYWGQLRTEFSLWTKGLGMSITGGTTGSTLV